MSDDGLWKAELLYCGHCNLRRYFVNGKCEACTKAVVAEEHAREDERQACWEDFIQVIRSAIKDAPHSMALKALHEAVYLMGWKELGTGDGKPMHKREGSAVSEWRADV